MFGFSIINQLAVDHVVMVIVGHHIAYFEREFEIQVVSDWCGVTTGNARNDKIALVAICFFYLKIIRSTIDKYACKPAVERVMLISVAFSY